MHARIASHAFRLAERGERGEKKIKIDYVGRVSGGKSEEVKRSNMREVAPEVAFLRDQRGKPPNDIRVVSEAGQWPPNPRRTWCRSKPKAESSAPSAAAASTCRRRPLIGMELFAGTLRLSRELVRHKWEVHAHDRDAARAEFDDVVMDE